MAISSLALLGGDDVFFVSISDYSRGLAVGSADLAGDGILKGQPLTPAADVDMLALDTGTDIDLPQERQANGEVCQFASKRDPTPIISGGLAAYAHCVVQALDRQMNKPERNRAKRRCAGHR